MAVYKIKKTENFVILDRTFLYDETLSWQAKGVLALLLSRPPDWEVHVSELIKHANNGEHSTRTALKELKARGYIVFVRLREGGRFSDSQYHVYEQPHPVTQNFASHEKNESAESNLDETRVIPAFSPDDDFQHVENPDVENLHLEIPDRGNQRLLSSNTTKKNNNKEKAAETPSVDNLFSLPAAAASSLTEEDYVIGTSLTLFQWEKIRAAVQQYQAYFPQWTPTQLFDELVFEIHDDSFSQCGRDFFKKLNVVKKAIREGQWQGSRRGVKNQEAKLAATQQAQTPLKARFAEVRLQLSSMLNEMEKVKQYHWPGLEALEEEVKQLQAEYDDLKQQLGQV